MSTSMRTSPRANPSWSTVTAPRPSAALALDGA
eukprot:CAMPEP_0197606860 /NCGR_PEP_ID=MMETSP1326-20131121/45942_1 /TAXON_ID=1155430 /ORGANISM="Genus nov. species nov., Strain RCC2288" /LENGTH=32 /DNA_ID= /DNA_START= /DNA_END= /DNA_ORIENTATION=